MNLKSFFEIKRNKKRKMWEFTPNEKVNSVNYRVSFYEAESETDAWITLFLAVKKSPEFSVKASY